MAFSRYFSFKYQSELVSDPIYTIILSVPELHFKNYEKIQTLYFCRKFDLLMLIQLTCMYISWILSTIEFKLSFGNLSSLKL